jgi:hypothetical protein
MQVLMTAFKQSQDGTQFNHDSAYTSYERAGKCLENVKEINKNEVIYWREQI